MNIEDMNEAIHLLAVIQQEQFQKQASCGKLQFTPYGKCTECSNRENCQRVEWILNVPQA